MEESNEAEQEQEGNGLDVKLLKSYLSFGVNAIKAHKVLIGAVLAVGVILTVVVVKLLPRTYNCTTVLMTVENAVLDDRSGGRPLAGAKGLLMRHENLENLIRETDLIKKYPVRRPPLLRFKDKVMATVFGPMDDKTMMAVLVGTLESKLNVSTEDDQLEISVNWSDSATTAEVAKAAQDGFLKIRHKAEISAFQEKMAIVDTHAAKLREEVTSLAAQLDAAQLEQAEKLTKAGVGSAAASAPVQRLSQLLRPGKSAVDEQLPEIRERLAALKQKLAQVEGDRTARMRDETAKLDELKLRFTPSHPQVIMQQERLAMASQVPSELALMRSEVADLESQVKQRDAMAKTGQSTAGAVGRAPAATAAEVEPIPADVVMLLSREEGDPALKAQLSGAVVRYGSLRDDVRAAKLALDTAQAAFNHRYQVVIPVEEPSKASKPNLLAIGAGGVFVSLLLALLIPVLIELRRGMLVEYWQVQEFQLPVLADLRLPPGRP